MLQEVLLSLSGHPSPLFDARSGEVTGSFPYLSPPEIELLRRIGKLSQLHRGIRTQLDLIKANLESPICKAVATAILAGELDRFQKQIIDVEESILKKDSRIVGAYNIVPLATIVGEFDEWPRLLEWIWQLTAFILPSKEQKKSCSGASLINYLRSESRTGYPDIGECAIRLSKVAELAWLRQLSNWLLFGQLPTHGASDFFIQPSKDSDFEIVAGQAPNFVSDGTASAILFTGRSLRQINIRTKEDPAYLDAASLKSEMELVPQHQRILSHVGFPISAASITEAVNSIRTSLSKKVLQRLLPVDKVLQLMKVIREFFLLGHGEFALSLIREADERLAARTKPITRPNTQDPLKGMVMKSGEVTGILRKTWAYLSALIDEDDDRSDIIEMGRDLIHFSSGKTSGRTGKHGKGKKVHFNDFLLPVATHLSLSIITPFDLFISDSETADYSDLNMYLLSIRRGHMHLSDLWKQSMIRKDHPTPRSCAAVGADVILQQRKRRNQRFVEMRRVWATCSASIYLLNELGEYFEGQVIPELWNNLLDWIKQPPKRSEGASIPDPAGTENSEAHDPASLSKAHKAFLQTLTTALLLHDTIFTAALRDFLRSADDLVAQILRLQTIQRNLDLEEDEGIFDALSNYKTDLEDCWAELDRARKRVDSGCRAVVERLRDCGQEAPTPLIQADLDPSSSNYHPATGAKIERLLMKLEIGNTSGEPNTDDINDDDY
jgi:gamma-tubulin complex component